MSLSNKQGVLASHVQIPSFPGAKRLSKPSLSTSAPLSQSRYVIVTLWKAPKSPDWGWGEVDVITQQVPSVKRAGWFRTQDSAVLKSQEHCSDEKALYSSFGPHAERWCRTKGDFISHKQI